MNLRICLTGGTGNVGRQLVSAILDAPDLELASVTGRRHAGRPIAELTGDERVDLTVSASLQEALKAGVDVVVDYTAPEAVKENVRKAIDAGCRVVIGTSGLGDQDYAEIDGWAKTKHVGVFAAGNFSITAALAQHFATLAARYLPHWEIIDYAADTKPDAPSGTARETAYLLGQVAQPRWAVPPGQAQGELASRGASLNGSQLHSVRVPGFYSSFEVIFGLPGERLSLRHDSMSYAPYVQGTLLAVRKVGEWTGLRRGMGNLLAL